MIYETVSKFVVSFFRTRCRLQPNQWRPTYDRCSVVSVHNAYKFFLWRSQLLEPRPNFLVLKPRSRQDKAKAVGFEGHDQKTNCGVLNSLVTSDLEQHFKGSLGLLLAAMHATINSTKSHVTLTANCDLLDAYTCLATYFLY